MEKECDEQGVDLNDADAAVDEKALEVLQQRNEQLMRALADSENRQKIVEREKTTSVRYAVADFAKNLLDVADALDSAVQSCAGKDLTGEAWTLNEGLVLTQSILNKVLEKHHIKVIAPQPGDMFDHSQHQAVSQEETVDYAEGQIVTLLRPGYFLEDRLLRAAFVTVAAAPKAPSESSDD